MQKYFDAVLSSDGSPVTGVNVTVKLSGTNTLATLFSDAAGTVPLTNPVVTDTRGIFQFYAADGRYDLTFSATGFSPYTFTDISIDEQDSASTIAFTPAGGISANTVAGALTELDSDKENVGVAASSMAAHLAASNPHSQYASAGHVHAASAVTVTPAGAIAATDVQSALQELDTEKAALSGARFTGATGYGTGSGGTVTQGAGSGKATAVTIDKLSGQITMNNAELAAGASISFQVLCPSFATTSDNVICTVVDDFGAFYTSEAHSIWNGYFYIRLTNVSGGSRSEAVKVNFSVIKGATS